MKKTIRAIIAVVLVLSLTLAFIPSALAAGIVTKDGAKLRFNTDGNFRILVLADIQDDFDTRPAVQQFIKAAVEKYKPDLIALDGDNTSGQPTKAIAKIAIDNVVKNFNNVPFALVFGNHDGENSVSKESLLKIYQSYDNCLANDDNDLYGCATYNLPILSSDGSKIAYNIWMFDSNMYEYDENGNELGYDYVHQDQIDWYVETSNALKAQNGGNPVYSMMFQHIIVNEVFDYLKEVPAGTAGAIEKYKKYWVLDPENTVSGQLNEGPCPGYTDSEQFETCARQGDVVGMVFGHDHVNSFIIETAENIDIIQTPAVTMQSYGSDATRGCRVIDINENTPTEYTTFTALYTDVLGDTEETRVMCYASEQVGWYYVSRIFAAIPFVGEKLAYEFLKYIYYKNNPIT